MRNNGRSEESRFKWSIVALDSIIRVIAHCTVYATRTLRTSNVYHRRYDDSTMIMIYNHIFLIL